MPPLPPHAAPLSWSRRIGLFALFMSSLLPLWAALSMQSCAARGAVQIHRQGRYLAAAAPVTVSSASVDRRHDGRLVHVIGRLHAAEPLTDPELGASADALALERRVEIYDWGPEPLASAAPSDGQSGRRQPSHGPRARNDALGWREQPMPAVFRDPEPGPPARPNSARFTAPQLRLDGLTLHAIGLPRELGEATEPLAVSADVLLRLPAPLRARARLGGDYIHVGDPAAVGDLRIRFRIAPSREVTVVAGQDQWGLSPYRLPVGEPVSVIKAGAAYDVLPTEAAGREAIAVSSMFALPLFAMVVFLAYWPVRAAGRVLPGLRVLVTPGGFVFFLLATPAAALVGAAYVHWANGVPGAALPTALAAAALGVLVLVGVRRQERLEKLAAARPPVPPSAPSDGDPCWHYLDRGIVRGPLTLAQVAAIACGRWPRDTMVWGPLVPGWVRAQQIPALAAALTRHAGRPVTALDKEESIGWFLFDWFVLWRILWPFRLGAAASSLGRDMRGVGPFTRMSFLGVTVLAFVVAFFFLTAVPDVLEFETSPAEAPVVRTVAVLFGVLGVVLPAVFMVTASRRRLRELGQDERRGLFILVPEINVFLWAQLLIANGAADKAASTRWTPVMPPPDTQRRR